MKTTYAGSGNDLIHPPQIDYNNPITSVYHISSLDPRFKFATKDGVISAHPPNSVDNQFVQLQINPPDT